MGNFMTNPVNKYTKEEFIKKVKDTNTNIEVFVEEYKGVDARYKYKCQHGISELYGWQLLKRKHCCKKDYWESKKKSDELATEEFIKKSKNVWREGIIDYSKCKAKADAANKSHKVKLRCISHNTWFEQHVGSHLDGRFGCPQCKSEQRSSITKDLHNKGILGGKSWRSVSKGETEWLNSLSVPIRQYRLQDVEFYNVDGYDPETNTVYLYHGRFWHGCPKTYDPDETHPVIGIKMKDLYEKTLFYENKIKSAGYNLVVKWGD
jgi:hypothetical protein